MLSEAWPAGASQCGAPGSAALVGNERWSVGLSVLLRLGEISFTKGLLPDTRAVT